MAVHFHGKMSLWTFAEACQPFCHFSQDINSNHACTHQSRQSCYPAPLIYIKSTLQLTQTYETLVLPTLCCPRQKGKVTSKPARI